MKKLSLVASCLLLGQYHLLASTLTYSASLDAVPSGAVPTGAFSFGFQSPNILVPSFGFPIDVTSEPGFTFVGIPETGFDLTSLLIATNGVSTYFQATLTNNSNNDSLVLNILPNPASLLSTSGAYPLLMFPNLIVPGTPGAIAGDTGTGLLLITSDVPEPMTAPLLVGGLVLVACRLRCKRSLRQTCIGRMF